MTFGERFRPNLVDLMETDQIPVSEYDSIRIGTDTPYGIIITKGDWISKLLAESPLIACDSRKAENCQKCVFLNRGCKASIRR